MNSMRASVHVAILIQIHFVLGVVAWFACLIVSTLFSIQVAASVQTDV